jgi:hypothetical protein
LGEKLEVPESIDVGLDASGTIAVFRDLTKALNSVNVGAAGPKTP